MTAIYNENEPYAVEWLRNLSRAGHIAAGEVDARSIRELAVSDVRGRRQAHFFAGLGGWSHALRLAGWPDELSVWTGSCPCQPFSQSGRKKGFADDRHLWPVWFELIRKCRPPVIFGEQVASPDGLKWFDVVCADLEGEGYAVGAADLAAAGVGAPHIRQRLFFVAISGEQRREGIRVYLRAGEPRPPIAEIARRRAPSNVANAAADGRQGDADSRRGGEGTGAAPRLSRRPGSEHSGDHGELADPGGDKRGSGRGREALERGAEPRGAAEQSPGRGDDGPWSAADFLPCTDGKARPVEPGTFPLAHGVPARVGKLRAYGNAIVPQVAATFIRAARSAMIEVQP